MNSYTFSLSAALPSEVEIVSNVPLWEQITEQLSDAREARDVEKLKVGEDISLVSYSSRFSPLAVGGSQSS